MKRLIGTVVAAVCIASLAPAATASVGDERVRAGRYQGLIHDIGKKPSGKEWNRFKVTPSRKYVKGFKAKLWVICYSYPGTYTRLPVKFDGPRLMRIRHGVVDRRWKKPFTVDGEKYVFKGRLKMRFDRRSRVQRGRIWVEFSSCGTTTGDPVGPSGLRAHRVR